MNGLQCINVPTVRQSDIHEYIYTHVCVCVCEKERERDNRKALAPWLCSFVLHSYWGAASIVGTAFTDTVFYITNIGNTTFEHRFIIYKRTEPV